MHTFWWKVQFNIIELTSPQICIGLSWKKIRVILQSKGILMRQNIQARKHKRNTIIKPHNALVTERVQTFIFKEDKGSMALCFLIL